MQDQTDRQPITPQPIPDKSALWRKFNWWFWGTIFVILSGYFLGFLMSRAEEARIDRLEASGVLVTPNGIPWQSTVLGVVVVLALVANILVSSIFYKRFTGKLSLSIFGFFLKILIIFGYMCAEVYLFPNDLFYSNFRDLSFTILVILIALIPCLNLLRKFKHAQIPNSPA